MKINYVKVADFAERVGSTFAAAFLGVALVTGVSDQKSLYAAVAAGAVSAGKFVAIELNGFNKKAGV